MQPGRFIAIISLIAPLTLPEVISAQGSSGAQLFTSYDNATPGGNGFAGFGLALGGGPLALRGSFGISMSSFSSANSSTGTRGPLRWNGDVDVILPDRFFGLGQLFGDALHPYGFAGVGARSIAASPTVADAARMWSYGGGVSFPLGPAVSIQGEMRNRLALGTATVSPSDFVPGTEFRVGLDFRFGGGRSSARVPSRGGSGTVWPAGNTNSSGAARRVVPRGEKYLGVPYVWGGETPSGFDCSGFVQYVYRHEGVDLPRTSRQMAGSGFGVDRQSMAVGDLMLFAQNGPISHVAIYAGNGRFIHSSSSGNGVRYDNLNTERGRWYSENLVAVRRVASGSGAIIASFAKSFIPFDGFDPPDLAPPVRRK
ncbi:MAG TPA: C40 family peptidase [Gemmatimonadaceae bacterium]|nr:C40 family peptidase [Gemmatimonadaceae bacterium]